MKYRIARMEDARKLTAIVQETIAEIYPKYYPREVVDFLGQLHCYENIMRDIQRCVVCIFRR
ncbi:MAG: hypothetical protein HFI37_05525 [Lachnospiraceae bacterium]|nr:hypothetical protein [Lachnospiraceae bacterium]